MLVTHTGPHWTLEGTSACPRPALLRVGAWAGGQGSGESALTWEVVAQGLGERPAQWCQGLGVVPGEGEGTRRPHEPSRPAPPVCPARPGLCPLPPATPEVPESAHGAGAPSKEPGSVNSFRTAWGSSSESLLSGKESGPHEGLEVLHERPVTRTGVLDTSRSGNSGPPPWACVGTRARSPGHPGGPQAPCRLQPPLHPPASLRVLGCLSGVTS